MSTDDQQMEPTSASVNADARVFYSSPTENPHPHPGKWGGSSQQQLWPTPLTWEEASEVRLNWVPDGSTLTRLWCC